MKKLSIFQTLTASALTLLVLSPVVLSDSISISISNTDNGHDSVNSASVAIGGGFSSIEQSNASSLINRISQLAETGRNRVADANPGTNSVVTGHVTQSESIVNIGNTNQATIGACFSGDGDCEYMQSWDHMGVITGVEQGTKKNGDPITDPNRTDPAVVNGSPDGSFFSLGKEGFIVFKFPIPIYDKPGTDITLAEVTNGATYPEENALVEVSRNGRRWYTLGTASSLNPSGISGFDLNSINQRYARYIRITDTTNYTPHADNADGFDLDALMVMRRICGQMHYPNPN